MFLGVPILQEQMNCIQVPTYLLANHIPHILQVLFRLTLGQQILLLQFGQFFLPHRHTISSCRYSPQRILYYSHPLLLSEIYCSLNQDILSCLNHRYISLLHHKYVYYRGFWHDGGYLTMPN